MQDNSNECPDFFPTLDKNLKVDHEPIDFSYHIKESWIRELGFQNSFIFSIISSLSTHEGYCYIKDCTLAKKVGLSVRSVERILNTLEEKKWIFRNSYAIHKGKKRHLVTKDNALSYWKKYLNRTVIPSEIKKKFINHFFELSSDHKEKPLSQKPKKSCSQLFTTDKNGGSYSTDKNGGSLLLRNNLVINDERNSAVAADFEKILLRELEESNIQGKRVEIALEFYKKFKSSIQKKENPIGYLIWAVKSGKAADLLHATHKHEHAKRQNEKNLEDNKHLATKVYQELKNQQQGFSVSLDEYSIRFFFEGKGRPLGWREENFEKLLTRERNKAYESIRNSRQSASMETCPL